MRKRWTQPPWSKAAAEVFEAFRSGTRLNKLRLPLHEGRIDLRGLSLPRPGSRGKGALPADDSSPAIEFTLIRSRFEVQGLPLKDIDLSFADLSDAVWRDCRFKSVLFRGATVRDGFFRSCSLDTVVFDGANLRDSLVGGCAGREVTSYRHASFRHADLRDTYYHYPTFEDCNFSGAMLDGVDFKGSRFTRCQFAGKLKAVWFRGVHVPETTLNRDTERSRRALLPPERVWNPMMNVDFSGAYLDECMFVEQIDLSHCVFPDDAVHIIIRDRRKVYAMAEAELARSWKEPARSEALAFLKRLAERKDKQGQKMDVLNRESFEKSPYVKPNEAKPWEHDFFDLLQRHARQTGV